jgi:dihydroorotate dehydrogenase (NAD+) catalytic subunit
VADLSVELAGLKLANPVLLASGILDSTPGILERMADSGAGALVTKSISL